MSILDAALSWAARGFRVFPLLPGDKIPPKDFPWRERATTDASTIRSWWSFEPRSNYGVACGDDLLVVDVDAAKGGFGSLFVLGDAVPVDTLTVRTPGGGVHLYLRGPDVANSIDKLAPGVDVRSKGGYVVGPGSFFADPTGTKGYTGEYVVTNDVQRCVAGEELILRAGAPGEKRGGPAVSVDDPADIAFAAKYLDTEAPIAVSGSGGNSTSYKVAARLFEIGLSEETATRLMLDRWNERCLPPWTPEEIRTFCRNAGAYAQNSQGSCGVVAQAGAGGDASDVLPSAPLLPASPKGKFDAVLAPRALTPIDCIPARPWIMDRLLVRGETSVLTGAGGAGKSAFILTAAAHGAVGAAFGPFVARRPFKTLVYNLEDGVHDMEARVHAICATHGLDVAAVSENLLLWNGRDLRFRLLGRDNVAAVADIQELARAAKAHAIDVISLDPLVSLHHANENDNTAMGDVIDAAQALSRLSNTALWLSHHAGKGSRAVGSADAARGASAIITSVRIAHTLFPADETDAALYGLGADYRARYARLDDAKMSHGELASKPLWLSRRNFPLPCGDASYALELVKPEASSTGEIKLIATCLASYMLREATMHLSTYDAARVLAAEERYFREEYVSSSGDLRKLKHVVEMRLAAPVVVDEGTVTVVARTEPGAAAARMFVELRAAGYEAGPPDA